MKKRTKEATIKTEVKNLSGKETIEHYNAILIESLKSEMKGVIEVVEESEAKSEKRDRELLKEMNQRFGTVEAALTHHTHEIKGLKSEVIGVQTEIKGLTKKVDENTKKIEENTQAIKTIDVHLSGKIDKFSNVLENHESRIATLEESQI
ncbi:hypothetical protein KKA47_02385 [bacterium]|nr:hypothetical protein [bacterium]